MTRVRLVSISGVLTPLLLPFNPEFLHWYDFGRGRKIEQICTVHTPGISVAMSTVRNRRSNFGFATLARRVALLRNEVTYRIWKILNRNRSFAEFYVWQVGRKLDGGREHKSLGKRRIVPQCMCGTRTKRGAAAFVATGTVEFEELQLHGIRPHHRVVEYGCGSLRVGQHCIRYLSDGNYVGMDITDRFFLDGVDLLEPGLQTGKRPRFFIIDDNSIRKVAAWKPDFIFATAVTQHVPPFELSQYIERLSCLRHQHARLVLFFVAADREVRVKGKSWAYPPSRLVEILRRFNRDSEIYVTRCSFERKPMNISTWEAAVVVGNKVPIHHAAATSARYEQKKHGSRTHIDFENVV